ncbi:MAG: hypothetical protein PHT00_03620 [Candidatus Methanomethylophilus sp.]|nr:hypothetical protein [Methanomethylophilus sp.]MDD3233242.1 hypothetical protein [Methanomethylophilus sp.]MDD4222655.1 hypothetical protein [Methanomethylophilus sp.]
MTAEFRQFALQHGVSEQTYLTAMRNLLDLQRMNPSVQFLVADAFSKYVRGEFTVHRMAELVKSQGYPTDDEKEMYFDTTVNGAPVTVFVTCCGVTPMPGRRTIALGLWNVSFRDHIEFYPFFAAAMFDVLDPSRPRDPGL